MERQAQAFIGTSGWSYADWRRDFYPKGLPSNQWLPHLARQFPTVELNASFYRMPLPATVRAWSRSVPEGFRFSAKMWRGITHDRQLTGYEDALGNYVDVVRNFPLAQRGPILVQLPPQLAVHLRRLEAFLYDLKERTRRLKFPLAVEFRHDSWITRSVWDLLDSMDVAVTVHDRARGAPVLAPNDASFVYVRRHGPKPGYQGSYPTSQLKHDAALVRAWLEQGRDVYLYFNNDRGGNAHRNAKELLKILEGRGVARPPRPQRGFTPLPANPTQAPLTA